LKKKILITLSALALTLVIGIGGNITQEDAVASKDESTTYMYYDPDIPGGIG